MVDHLSCTPWQEIPNARLAHRFGFVIVGSARSAWVDVVNTDAPGPQGGVAHYSGYVESVQLRRTDLPRTTTCRIGKWLSSGNQVMCRYEYPASVSGMFDYTVRYLDRDNTPGAVTRTGLDVG